MSKAFEVIIGLEVHIRIRTAMKMFCRCPNDTDVEPNTHVCPICLGYPGCLPVPNEKAIQKTLLAGLMCDCELASYSKFDRKSYFYPDMTKNYQTSQYDLPLCGPGHLFVEGEGLSGTVDRKKIGITRIHLEEDAGKLNHFGRSSGVDYNRAGVPLMEIVSEPDIRSADEAYLYLNSLKQIMQYADISDCDMEKGQMRCDVNISLRWEGETHFNAKSEIKNLNSFKAVHRAIEFEIDRQLEILEGKGEFVQATLLWDDDLGETRIMRLKENADDYRYFPCPDLMPMTISDALIAELKDKMPETPAKRMERYVTELELPPYDAGVLTAERAVADYFEAVVAAGAPAKKASNWMMGEMLRLLSEKGLGISDCPVTSDQLAKLIMLVEKKTINNNAGKKVLGVLFDNPGDPEATAKKLNLIQESDEGAILGFVQQAIEANPGPAQEYRDGQEKALNFLVGQVMRNSRGKANPQLARDLLIRELN